MHNKNIFRVKQGFFGVDIPINECDTFSFTKLFLQKIFSQKFVLPAESCDKCFFLLSVDGGSFSPSSSFSSMVFSGTVSRYSTITAGLTKSSA
jgi:hypothetical protein